MWMDGCIYVYVYIEIISTLAHAPLPLAGPLLHRDADRLYFVCCVVYLVHLFTY
jgi:hypothetical protein